MVCFFMVFNLKNHSTNYEGPCTTNLKIKKVPLNCQSSLSPDLVSFPALRQIKPHIPLLVVTFRQFF